ncbi:hypothetical protein [Dyadobacter sandarakinus]|uniref:Uncharacterized protein n=1 Tax=Dyadobacter sandarakinus TaxID=2747268 RepID=A0ABX7I2A0_9BACT|nr:hypothetical protein [Dyadobacter sandarakinus]QRR00211.1 hypothetical protein HWI92_04475 [Dyadobacter sandarakinus]
MILDGNDPAKSDIVRSESQADWIRYQAQVQLPYQSDLKNAADGENRVRAASDADSLQFWLQTQRGARRKWQDHTRKHW